jgi:hypothetical protein
MYFVCLLQNSERVKGRKVKENYSDTYQIISELNLSVIIENQSEA